MPLPGCIWSRVRSAANEWRNGATRVPGLRLFAPALRLKVAPIAQLWKS